MSRATFISRDLQAGCFTCHGADAHWHGAHSQGTAARHHDHTGHPTWCDVAMTVRYGRHVDDGDQLDIETAIAAELAA